MQSTHSEILPEIGYVEYVHHSRARRLRLVVRPDHTVRVTIPRTLSIRRARQFVLAQKSWIHSQRIKWATMKQQHDRLPIFNEHLSTRAARNLLIKRLQELADTYRFSYNRVFIRNQRTRWGSCSHANNINLNIKLIKLPPELRDYVILHELMHTRIKNHSPAFWQELNHLVGNARLLDRHLKTYRISML